MKISARIKVLNAPVTGVSKKSGNAYKIQELILGWDEPYGDDGRTREQLLMVKLSGRSVDALAEQGAKQGDMITGDLDFDTRQYGERVYNDISLYVRNE